MCPLAYSECIATLNGYIYRGLPPNALHTPDEMRPARSRRLLEALGNPQLRYPTLHITGTKGKGSVAAMCAAMLQAAGLRVGLLTSPHLQDLRERIQVNRVMIAEDEFAALFNEHLPLYERETTARFPEIIVSLAFSHFARQKVDIAVVEVGLGGRLDSTNALAPLATLFTSISYDHMHLLGGTLAAIAREKAGIMRPGAPVISAPQADEARAVLEDMAAAQGCPFVLIGRDVPFEPLLPARDGQGAVLALPGQRPQVFQTSLIGRHQAVNAAVAVTAMHALRQRGFSLPDDAIRRGLANVNWPGRMEVLPGHPALLLDAAHNPASARALRENVETLFEERPIVLIYGSKALKDVSGILAELLPMADHVILTQSADQITQPPDALIEAARQTGYGGPIERIPALDEAIRSAARIAHSASADGLVCITGSLYIVGEARARLGLAPNRMATQDVPMDWMRMLQVDP